MIDYPSADDYYKAIQQPELVFTASELKSARFAVHPRWGIPLLPASGSTAVVFKAVVSGEEQALRFFTRHEVSSRERYDTLNQHFQARGIADCVATSQWCDNAIVVKGERWPVVRMQWVEGRNLDKYIEGLVEDNNPEGIGALASAWRTLLNRMQLAEFAHGDLQHGNVLVDTDGKLRLVDFDGSWIPPFAGKPAPSESGHRNYQRSGRPWGQWMDTFPALVIYTSLLALSKDTRLWGSLNNEQNLLFSLEDFEPPYQTEVWQRLEAVGDRELSSAAARLKEYCAPGLSPSGALEGLLERPWWERTRGAAPAPEGRAGQTQRPRRPAEPDDPSLPPPKKIEPSPAPPTAPIPPPPADAPWWPTEARTPAGSPPTGEPSWWAGSQQPKPQAPPGPVSPGKPGKPPGRRSARRRWVIALVLIILALIVVFVVIPRIIVPLVIQSSFYRANAPHPTSQYTATQMFGTVLNGTCEQRTDRITSYDSELLGCSSSRYTRFFVKYSGTNPAGWADVAKKGYSTFVLKQADSCRDTYEATFTANVPRNAVIYVYRSTPFVAGIAADASDADLAAVRGATYYYLTDPGNSGSATLATSSC